eukprot:CAMPEP_0206530376 /NCGR_PEP_ID=MMETSP0325_2-20121206/3134_1 /ASSEMBLY_ACC=CAM_ASM_000347 /TAXON_ID=2866 /ORGANISM="Crypthecodinium cohnii, Strain Seligo" /LENGTH=83 /DNA_ID=CAMNT_0054026419 /DNA_START=611 /DNA_END=862 /DNA_ORIENTATION=-
MSKTSGGPSFTALLLSPQRVQNRPSEKCPQAPQASPEGVCSTGLSSASDAEVMVEDAIDCEKLMSGTRTGTPLISIGRKSPFS